MGYDTEKKLQWMIELLMASYPQGLNTHQLADALETTQQSIRNYLTSLQDKEVPLIEVEPWVFTIDPSDYVRPLRLSLAQAWFLYLLVRRVVRADLSRYTLVNSLLTRLLSSLHGDIAGQINLGLATQRTAWDSILEVLIEGWHKQKLVRIQYSALGASTPTIMTVAPWSLEPAVWTDSNYLIAGVIRKDGYQTLMLKLDRIKSAQLLSERFERPSADDLLQRVNESWGIWGSDQPVTVALRFNYRVVERVHETRWHPTQSLQPQSDGSLLWTALVAEPREMMPWIRGWGSDVEVLEPKALRAEIAAEAQRTARLYAAHDDERSFF